MKKARKIIAILLTIAVIIYVIASIFMLLQQTSDTYVVKQGTISEEDESIGYIIRAEKVVKGENYTNGIYAIASEGQRVAKGEPIFRYYSDSEQQIKDKISGINYKIQELLEQDKNNTSADIKSIEKQIEEELKHINTLNNYQEIIESKKNIDNMITKKINFIGDVTENKEIKSLVKERNSYENQLKNGSEYQKAEISGLVSYRVDGIEETLSPDKFNEITEQYLNNLDLQTGKIISTSNECGKVIDNFKCYIAVSIKSQNAMAAKVGDSVQLRISNNREYDAKIIQINEESGKRMIIFQINKMTEELISHRKVIVDVIWWNDSGLKVPKQALIQENGLYYVIRNKAGIQTKLLVNVKRQTDKFAIITPYTDKELKELGFTSTEIRNYKKITNYDEIIINQ
ncbi:MAG: hypothetical protein IJE68_02410 [Clostridia bacterium]|nr:hypothetical protein [Clostridia bacterium]